MEKKDLITVRDYSYDSDCESLGYYRPKLVSARDYVNNIVEQLKGKKEKVSSFMTVTQFANELREAQFTEEEKATQERIEAYMSKPYEQRKYAD